MFFSWFFSVQAPNPGPSLQLQSNKKKIKKKWQIFSDRIRPGQEVPDQDMDLARLKIIEYRAI